MSESRHLEAQIITALKQVEAGRAAEDVAREQAVGKHTIYARKAKYGGMEVSEADEVKRLRDESSRLKKLVADLSLHKDTLQSVIRKNSLGSHPTPPTKGAAGTHRRTEDRGKTLAGGAFGQRAPSLHPSLRANGGAEMWRQLKARSVRVGKPGSPATGLRRWGGVCQPQLRGSSRHPWNQGFHEPQGRLLRQRLLGATATGRKSQTSARMSDAF